MPTFLTTPRMNAALRARVERAVSHRERAKHHAAKVGLKSPFASSQPRRLARLLPAVALLLVVGLGSATYVHGQGILEDDRSSLLHTIEERRAALPAGHETFLAEVNRWIGEAAAETPPPEYVDPALREPGALDALLGRPAVYVRGPAIELRDAAKIDDAVAGSIKDAFLFCLMTPPASSSERDLLAKVRGVYFGGALVDDETANVRRLAEAWIGLPVLAPAFEASVRAAEEPLALKKLRKDLQSAPTEEAAKAAAAQILLVVADEPSAAGARAARVSIVDLASQKPLLRARLRSGAVSQSALASLHREAIEGCGLAASVRGGVED